MEKREFLKFYLRSPLGIGSLVVSAGAALAASSAMGPAAGLLTSVGVLAAGFALSLATGLGSRAAAAESGRGAAARFASRLAEASAARDRLAAIRLAAPGVAQARDLLVLEAGRFIEACGRSGGYDPEGVEAILGSVALVDAWLKERDESASERRYAIDDANPFPEAEARTVAVLRERAALVSRRRALAIDDISPAVRMEIEEELK